MIAPAILCCLLIFHSPDGSVFFVERDAIKAIKPVPVKHHDHVAGKTHSVIFLGVRSAGFGLAETVSDVSRAMTHCDELAPAPSPSPPKPGD